MKTLLGLLLLGTFGCLTHSSRLEKINVGMTREQVIEKLGKPDAARVEGEKEYLVFMLRENFQNTSIQPYYVRLRQGRVQEFGRQKRR